MSGAYRGIRLFFSTDTIIIARMNRRLRNVTFAALLIWFVSATVWADPVVIDLTAGGAGAGTPSMTFAPTIPGVNGFQLTVSSLSSVGLTPAGNVTQSSVGLESDLAGSSALGTGEALLFDFDPELFVTQVTLRDVSGGLYLVAISLPGPQGTKSGFIGAREYQIDINSTVGTMSLFSLGGEFSVAQITVSPEPFGVTSSTPEPTTLLLFGTGLLAGAAGLRRRFK